MMEGHKEDAGPALTELEELATPAESAENPTQISPVEAEVKIPQPRPDSYHPCFGGRMEGGLPRRR
jgi:hypothetical protein